EALLRAALRARAGEVGLHQALGNVLAGQQRWREAAESYATARALRPEVGLSLAQARVKAGEVREGLALFEHLRAERQGDPWVYVQLGNALSDDPRRHEDAEAAYRGAIRLRPHYPGARKQPRRRRARDGRHD